MGEIEINMKLGRIELKNNQVKFGLSEIHPYTCLPILFLDCSKFYIHWISGDFKKTLSPFPKYVETGKGWQNKYSE